MRLCSREPSRPKDEGTGAQFETKKAKGIIKILKLFFIIFLSAK